MEKRALLAVVLSLLVFIIYTQFLTPKPAQPPSTPPKQAEEAAPPTTAQPTPLLKPAAPAASPAARPQPTERPVREIEVENGLLRLIFSEKGARLRSCRLLRFKETNDPHSPPKELIDVPLDDLAPLGLSSLNGRLPGLDDAVFGAETDEQKITVGDKPREIIFRWLSPSGVEVVKRFIVRPQDYVIGLKVELINRSAKSLDDNLGLALTARQEKGEGGRYAFKGFGAFVNNKLFEEKPKKFKEEPMVLSGDVSWGGYENSYFLQALIPLSGQGSFKASLAGGEKDREIVVVRYTSPPFSLAVGGSESFDFDLFFGPKEIGVLNRAGHNLDAALNMGWFDLIAKPFLYFLKYIYKVVPNFGVAIIILTIGVKIIFWPLTQKSYKSMKAMQKLQPQMAKLRERYKNDKQRMNQELMGLYKAHKVNPMGGCLPMIIQIPVFIALYRLLDYAIELRHAPFLLWISDLAAPDRLFRFPFHLPLMEPPYGIPVLTLLMGASMFLQQKMTPTPGDPTQAKVMLLMPIVFTFVFINFPSGLVLYWLTNNVLSIAQQVLINRSSKF